MAVLIAGVVAGQNSAENLKTIPSAVNSHNLKITKTNVVIGIVVIGVADLQSIGTGTTHICGAVTVALIEVHGLVELDCQDLACAVVVSINVLCVKLNNEIQIAGCRLLRNPSRTLVAIATCSINALGQFLVLKNKGFRIVYHSVLPPKNFFHQIIIFIYYNYDDI